jgi:hypothetical protein
VFRPRASGAKLYISGLAFRVSPPKLYTSRLVFRVFFGFFFACGMCFVLEIFHTQKTKKKKNNAKHETRSIQLRVSCFAFFCVWNISRAKHETRSIVLRPEARGRNTKREMSLKPFHRFMPKSRIKKRPISLIAH